MSGELVTYEKFKDSEVAWLGKVPQSWQVNSIKHTSYLKGRVGWKGLTSDEYLDDGYAYLVTGTDFNSQYIEWTTCQCVDQERYDDDPFIWLSNGDLLITKDGTIGKLAMIRDLRKPACLNSGIFLVRPLDAKYSTRYLFWILSSQLFESFVDFSSSGSTIQHLYQNVFETFKFPMPTLLEQESIASYLDTQTQRIDTLIKEQQELIELLREKRRALISQAVTKGLDPNVELKDSGVEWLGEIPEHWKVPRLAHVASVENGATPSRDDPSFWSTEEDGIPWLSSGDVNQYIVRSCSEWVSALGLEKTSIRLLPIGSLIVGMIGEGKTRGTSARLSISATINQNIAGVVPGEFIDSEFLHFVFQASYDVLRNLGRGGNQSALNCEILSSFRIPRPDPQEQKLIATFLTDRTAKINSLTAEAETTIAIMQEHRSALISAVVTGKVKVPA